MTSIRPGSWSGEVMRKVDEYCAGDVRVVVLRPSPSLIVEVIAAVGDEPGRIGEVFGEHIG